MRRTFLARMLALPALGLSASQQTPSLRKMKVLIKSAWGSADPTQAAFPFHHANAFADGGHEVHIFLLGEAVTLMRTTVANAIVPVGWPPLSEALTKVMEHKVPIHV
jgi:predicted peroxiredoxin